MRMLREALRLGEVELKVVRPEAVHSKQKALFSKNNFPPPTLPKTVSISRETERSSSVTYQPETDTRMRNISVSSSSTRNSPISDSDYRVTSFHEKPGPGKLADFIPEVERGKSAELHRRKYLMDNEEDLYAEDSKIKDPVVAVSGKHRCSHCQMELGRGAAMIIESLNLFYHLSCFRCYVCNAALGNGTRGADVRVRDSKLHCQNCYCNEEAGLKYSQV
ncbi:unnamed protein product [Enterobius vermicularis]|uniref:LIM zinc-binding domain-containing protein n=1 Tax=Enterobius vermicularis TaxID=51028 RepID=A0A0N4VCJ4_ENTVE|nr:unnamed protein product [Enterobius vermicularis]